MYRNNDYNNDRQVGTMITAHFHVFGLSCLFNSVPAITTFIKPRLIHL